MNQFMDRTFNHNQPFKTVDEFVESLIKHLTDSNKFGKFMLNVIDKHNYACKSIVDYYPIILLQILQSNINVPSKYDLYILSYVSNRILPKVNYQDYDAILAIYKNRKI